MGLIFRRLLFPTSALLLLCCSAAMAATGGSDAVGNATTYTSSSPATDSYPVIRDIGFEGNKTTRPPVMLREIVVHVGEPADPNRIEKSRQAVQDLGLFRTVTVREEPDGDGVRLVFVVVEKWYVLPLPRVGYDSDKHLTYGGAVTWYNVAGLDQTLHLNWVRGNSPEPGHAAGQTWSGSYAVPFIGDSPWQASISGGHGVSPVVAPTAYTEFTDDAQLLFTRSLSGAAPFSQGWHLGGGLLWQNEDNRGMDAPAPYGAATALVGVAQYRDFHNLIYSETGVDFSMRGEVAMKGVASDYSYEMITAQWRRDLALGDLPYQSLNFVVDGGMRFDGPGQQLAFGIGGRGSLPGYQSDFLQGADYYHFGIEYLRPLHWNWLRGLVTVDAANAFDRLSDASLSRVHTSLGLGVRARFTYFVDFQLEAGVAVPLDSINGPRFFGGHLTSY